MALHGLNLTDYTVQGESTGTVSAVDEQFKPPFIYDCYGVIVHSGTLSGGHYQAYVKQDDSVDPKAWNHFNDSIVTPIKISDDDQDKKARESLYDNSGSSTYVVFYQRRTS